MKTYKLVLLGFGNVGQALARLLLGVEDFVGSPRYVAIGETDYFQSVLLALDCDDCGLKRLRGDRHLISTRRDVRSVGILAWDIVIDGFIEGYSALEHRINAPGKRNSEPNVR